MPDTFEIVFSFDTTGSMYSCLEEVRRQLRDLIQDLNRNIPGIKIAIFAHGDYCDAGSKYVTKYVNFTNDANKLCNWVKDVEATHGGDYPECYELVMREVQEKLSWTTGSQRSLVLIGDAPPHEASEAQNTRSLDWKTETVRLRNMNIKIYAVECHGSRLEFYQHISSQTFGFYMPLSNIKDVKDLLKKICFREAGVEGTGTGTAERTGTSSTPAVAALPPPDINTFKDQPGGMVCIKCEISKLANEFPPEDLTEQCDHYIGVCLRCVTDYVQKNRKCPQCSTAVEPNCRMMIWYQSILDTMFLDYAKVLEEVKLSTMPGKEVVTVATMNGDTAWIPFDSNMTIAALKKQVKEELNIDEKKQKLLYNEKVLKLNKSPGNPYQLCDFNIGANASIQLIVPLYSVPENFNHVVFDLSWEFPRNNPDFLDASCLTFNNTNFIQVIDWNHSTNDYYLKGAVVHSARNETAGGGKFGHQTIHVYMKKLPSTVTHLYFTLSSWKSKNLAAFSSPSLQFYEASDPGANLCGTTIGHALSSQALIMCSVARISGQWQIFECDSHSLVDGNSKRYEPIRQRIAELIAASDDY